MNNNKCINIHVNANPKCSRRTQFEYEKEEKFNNKMEKSHK